MGSTGILFSRVPSEVPSELENNDFDAIYHIFSKKHVRVGQILHMLRKAIRPCFPVREGLGALGASVQHMPHASVPGPCLGPRLPLRRGASSMTGHREPAPSLFPAPGHLTGFRESTAFDRARGSPSPGYPLLGRRRVDPGGRQEGPWSGVRVRVAMLPDHPGPGLLPRRAEGGGAGVFFFPLQYFEFYWNVMIV